MTAAPEASMVPAQHRFLSRVEVAALFDVSPHTIYRWTREGRLPYVLTPGGRRRYPREEIERIASTWLRVHPARERAFPKAG